MYDLVIHLQLNSKECLYEQIYRFIRQEIEEGKLLAGERLPSTRSLAGNLQVARSTVDNAYEQLLSEGYIESIPYKGFFVCKIEQLGYKRKNKSTHPKTETGEQPKQKKENELPGFRVDFSPNAIEMSAFPFSLWKKITRSILSEDNQELFSLGEAQGDYELRETISRYLHSSRGVNCTPNQIIVGAGNDYMLLLLEKIFSGKQHIAMENPTYKRAYRIFDSMEYSMEPVDMDENGLRVKNLSGTNANIVYVMPSHQFPTGAVMPISRRTALLAWANEGENRYIIEDDYDSEFRYRGKPIPSLQSSDEHGKVIYIGTFSKAIAPAIRISFMVLPEMLLEQYHKNCKFFSCPVSRIDQRILNDFIKGGFFERYLNKMRKVYRARHDFLLEQLTDFEGDFQISGDNAGLHLVLTAKNGRTEQELLETAKAQGVKVYGLSDSLVAHQQRKPSVLLGFGGLGNQEIQDGIAMLRKAWL